MEKSLDADLNCKSKKKILSTNRVAGKKQKMTEKDESKFLFDDISCNILCINAVKQKKIIRIQPATKKAAICLFAV